MSAFGSYDWNLAAQRSQYSGAPCVLTLLSGSVKWAARLSLYINSQNGPAAVISPREFGRMTFERK